MPGYDAPAPTSSFDNAPPAPLHHNRSTTLPTLPSKAGGYNGKVFMPKAAS